MFLAKALVAGSAGLVAFGGQNGAGLKGLLSGQIGLALLAVSALIFVGSLFKALAQGLTILVWGVITGFLFLQVYPNAASQFSSTVLGKAISSQMEKSNIPMPKDMESATKQAIELLNQMKKMKPDNTNPNTPSEQTINAAIAHFNKVMQDANKHSSDETK